MIERLRFLLDRPLDPLAARAVLVLAGAILLAFGALFVLGAGESDHSATGRHAVNSRPRPTQPPDGSLPEILLAQRRLRQRERDPLDEKGSAAAHRATEVLRSHRALQHLPYRRGSLSIRLIGARGGRAVLAVSAPRISAAHQGWRQFLQRYGDSGRSYLPRFSSSAAAGKDG